MHTEESCRQCSLNKCMSTSHTSLNVAERVSWNVDANGVPLVVHQLFLYRIVYICMYRLPLCVARMLTVTMYSALIVMLCFY